ncbi:hypothetical protein BD31_I0829 [Candidatus Nitrosopumilus salaria BD31]|uniref:Uncharacterized protein n=1 Tax=Candidatus Nitrosopumilus salarius BD31 TaxID=859350 RepID=I3D1Z7_9ARCH|nr:hypothetical protein [Candidatus Nitrosopumilus salaria]EIJ65740.1 hypothetical protein BD31_I0829 [Candidatus Nitrosopumilus salaria BD31]
MLEPISVRGFEPKTAKPGEEVARKITLRDFILTTHENLDKLREKYRGKNLSLNVIFYLYSGNIADSSRYVKDLDNLLKIVLDILPDYMDSAKKESGLGIIEGDRDDLIHEIHTKKEFVLDQDKEGMEIEISEVKN